MIKKIFLLRKTYPKNQPAHEISRKLKRHEQTARTDRPTLEKLHAASKFYCENKANSILNGMNLMKLKIQLPMNCSAVDSNERS